ncbi:MAG: hypothetical protein BGN88_03770 [Clostridiales bacterium 43-6]|nr:MAG: hypothetical protein BGN88_03770 [Clostridiales bacterium 43-6]
MNRKIKILFLLLCVVLLLLTGCDKKEKAFAFDKTKPSVHVMVKGPDSETILDTTVGIDQNCSVFDATKFACRLQKKVIETKGSGSMVYVSGIAGIMEYDYGGQSGWLYCVNNDFATAKTSSGAFLLKDQDKITWYYTKNMGLGVGAKAVEK